MDLRPLTSTDIQQLTAQGCSAEDWTRVRVEEPFHPERIRETDFSGDITLGIFEGTVQRPGGIAKERGIYRCHLHNCTVGTGAYLRNVGVIANYSIAEGVIVENVHALRVVGETAFGNGVEIDVLNEAGGRTLKICDRLSAQLAYLIVFYRHHPALIAKLTGMIDEYVTTRRTNCGSVGAGVEITNTGIVTNVQVGAYARIDGAASLEEGTIQSCREAPVFIGTGVVAKRFVILSGSKVDQSAIIDKCFIGQSVKMGKQYSAENSAFFCNSELFHGEGCSVFAGPYTVTHHKSTLLIAGFFSFYNAGSGTNQSNHMYKLGPVHQGILERGSKTGSFSYLLWPSRVGPFSTIIGKHYSHFDTSDLPFSTINEHEGRSVCVPGMNMFTVGTRRDSLKWPARDGRKDPKKLDVVHFSVWSPYVIGKILRGLDTLNELAKNLRPGQEYLNYNGISIQKLLVKTAGKYYEMAIKLFIGNCLVRKLGSMNSAVTVHEVRTALSVDIANEQVPWLDINGLLAPETIVQDLVTRIVDGKIRDLDQLQAQFASIHADYERQEWSWCAKLIETRTGVSIDNLSIEMLRTIVEDWKATVLKFNNMILQDAGKEFDSDTKLSYGIDGNASVHEADFAAVRGTLDTNSFVKSVKEDSALAEAKALKAVAFLSQLA